MSFLKNWTAKPTTAPATQDARLLPESVPLDLAPILAALGQVLAEIEPAALDVDVARAKLADLCRDLAIEPVDPLELDPIAAELDRGAIERLALLVLVLERRGIPEALLKRIFEGRARTAAREGLFDVARGSSLVTLDLLRGSPLRREELARRLVLGLGASVAGESLAEARAALERLDYGRLMAEAERARRAAGKG
ncbi:hypothetical protein [Polyangium jinanense]|uniref:Uncharacterized protein n=1 Tax=Polyangium jinanense TaxID=2829994 RepID=A0A9X3XF46_9BACT|nr:hypothetical protein [Polyangium jinanense]MDC3958380.1 hypothetical protein [Polyangium jinanense]MDC3988290.1 hypothetical protein [Polyangium jinanense]